MLLHANHEQSKKGVKEIISFTITSQRIKYVGVEQPTKEQNELTNE